MGMCMTVSIRQPDHTPLCLWHGLTSTKIIWPSILDIWLYFKYHITLRADQGKAIHCNSMLNIKLEQRIDITPS